MCYKWLSEHLMAIMFYTIQKKGLLTIAHKWLFHPAWAAPSSDGGEDRRMPRAIPARRPTNRHHHSLVWNSNLENCYGEEIWRGRKLIGSIKWIQRLQMRLWVHCFSRCQYYDIYIMIYSSILKSSNSELVIVLQLLLMSRFGDLHCFINYNRQTTYE